MALTSHPQITRQTQVAGWLTPKDFSILEAIYDTLLPSLEPPAGSSAAMAAYYRRNAGDLHDAWLVAETLAQENRQVQAQLRQLLAPLTSPIAGLLLVGS